MIVRLLKIKKSVSFRDTDWNIYKWNDTMLGNSYKIIGVGGGLMGGYTDETRLAIYWLLLKLGND